MNKLICAILLFIATTNYSAVIAQEKTTLAFASVLQSNMVVQQNKPFAVWGHARVGDTVTIKADWLKTGTEVIASDSNTFIGFITVPLAKKMILQNTR